ncbi:hypothetical protein WMF38_54755 [Sorangium sp. So ce118]
MAEHVKGNEQATKQSLIGPLFTLLGYDLTDPRQCLPEYRVDFGKDRSVTIPQLGWSCVAMESIETSTSWASCCAPLTST